MNKPYNTPEEEAKYWRDAFWDMMYKKYCDLPVSVKIVDPGKVLSFKAWWEGQLSIIEHQYIRSKGLEEKNYKQAGMLMSKDVEITFLTNKLAEVYYPCNYHELMNMPSHNCQCESEENCFGGSFVEYCRLEEKEMKENTAEVLPFRLGNSSEPPINKNWLRSMVNGTRFLASRKSHDTHELDDFVVSSDPKTLDAVFLGKNLNTREGKFVFVDPVRFSRDYDLFMTLEIIEIPDGNSNKVEAGRIQGDTQPEVVPSLHEKE